jgi:hypothetical protein
MIFVCVCGEVLDRDDFVVDLERHYSAIAPSGKRIMTEYDFSFVSGADSSADQYVLIVTLCKAVVCCCMFRDTYLAA